jgi:hypothetical protein
MPRLPRLGELLVAAGLLTIEQVEQALRAQVLWGGRLGTNLVELHLLELDALSMALGRQHRLPAALARHFEKADPELQRMLSPDFAERFSCVPLLRMGPAQHVAIASLSPLEPRQLAIIADELAVDVHRLVPAIAAELRIRYQLERVYDIRRAARFLRARGKTVPPFPDFQILAIDADAELTSPVLAPVLPTTTQEIKAYRPEADLEPPAPAAEPDDDLLPVEVVPADDLDDLSLQAQLDDLAIPGEPVESGGRERRTYIPTIADAPSSDAERQALLGRIAIRKLAIGAAPGAPAPPGIPLPTPAPPVPARPGVPAGTTLAEVTRAIRRSTGRDRVADLVIDALERFAPACGAAMLLVIRGATAIGWKGFQRGGGPLGEIAVPMERGGLVPMAVGLNLTLRKSCAELDDIDRLLLASLGRETGDLVVVPIAIAEQVMCVIALATVENAPVAAAEPIAIAAGVAFARLMRNASR